MAQREERVRLVPLMVLTVTALAVFFFGASLWQLWDLNTAVEEAPGIDGTTIAERLEALSDAVSTVQQTAIQRALLVQLELDLTNRRHYITGVFLRTSVWIKYLGFVTGMIFAVVGAVFILGRLHGPKTTVGGEVASIKYQVQSASPGIILAVLGVALMISTLAILHKTEITDRNVYLTDEILLALAGRTHDGGGNDDGTGIAVVPPPPPPVINAQTPSMAP